MRMGWVGFITCAAFLSPCRHIHMHAHGVGGVHVHGVGGVHVYGVGGVHVFLSFSQTKPYTFLSLFLSLLCYNIVIQN